MSGSSSSSVSRNAQAGVRRALNQTSANRFIAKVGALNAAESILVKAQPQSTAPAVIQRNCRRGLTGGGDPEYKSILLDVTSNYADDVKTASRALGNAATREREFLAKCLYRACKYANPQIVQLLLHYGADPTVTHGEGANPPHCALSNSWGPVESRAMECARHLLKHKAVDVRTAFQRRTPIEIAVRNEAPLDIVKRLLKKECDPNQECCDGSPVIALAVESGDFDTYCCLRENEADLEQLVTFQKIPLLHLAARVFNQEIILDLLNHGARVDAIGRHGRTALFEAVKFHRTPSMRTLIKAGADVNMQDDKGITPLMVAASQSNLEAVKVLIVNNAQIDVVNNYSQTVKDFCGPKLNFTLIEQLFQSHKSVMEAGMFVILKMFELYNDLIDFRSRIALSFLS